MEEWVFFLVFDDEFHLAHLDCVFAVGFCADFFGDAAVFAIDDKDASFPVGDGLC